MSAMARSCFALSGISLVSVANIREQLVVYNEFVSALLERDSVNLLALDLSGNIVGVDLDYVVVALFLALEYLKSLTARNLER